MVDTSSSLNTMLTQDHIRMDQLDRVAEIWFGNIAAVIKLR